MAVGQRQRQPYGQRRRPGEAKRHASGEDRRGGQQDLQAPEADQSVPHVPECARLQLQPDDEQHHDHAELGKMLNVDRVHDQPQSGPDGKTGQQVSKHRPQA